MIELVRKNSIEDPVLTVREGVPFFEFSSLKKEEWLTHCFSTRLGGVSSDCYTSMNLGFLKDDARSNVEENYRRLGRAAGFDPTEAVLSYQTHTTNVRRVTDADRGKGVVRERDYKDVDGLITDIPGIALVTFYADCVPLYFADTRSHAIGLSHSGWRGTVNRMGARTLEAMRDAFGTRPEDVIAVVGPSICRDCFEVGPEVAEAFAQNFTAEEMFVICHDGIGDRKQIDLWAANRFVLEGAGIPAENITVTNVCTRCNPDVLYSHRIMGPQRGNLAAVLMIR